MNEFDIGWELWRSFLAAMNEKSVAGAARRLGVSQPTVSRHIDQIETALHAKLFTRSQNGLSPTDLAVALEPHAAGMAASADALMRAASGEADGEEGVVRLTATEIVSTEILPAILADFMREHPGIRIELHVSNKNADLLRRDADIAVRMERPQQGALLARRLGSVRFGFFAHRNYVEARGMPQIPADLDGHVIIGPDREMTVLRGQTLEGSPITPEVFSFRTDHHPTQLAALRTGIGIGVCQIGIASREPDLVHLLGNHWHKEFDVWLSMHEDLRTSHRVKLVYDYIGEALIQFLRG